MLIRVREHGVAAEQFGHLGPRGVAKLVDRLDEDEALQVAQLVRVWLMLCGTIDVRT